MGFTLKILTSYIKSVASFWGNKITIRKTINTKLKKYIFFIYISSENPYITLKRSSTNVILSCLLPLKGKSTISTSPFNNWT